MDEGQRASELTKFAGDARGVGAWGPSDLSLTFGPKSGSWDSGEEAQNWQRLCAHAVLLTLQVK
jgi:hypothetical protein